MTPFDKSSLTDSFKYGMCVPARNAKNHSEKSTAFDQLPDRLGGLVLKEKQKVVVKNLLEGKDVFAMLPTGFGKSLISQSFIMAKEIKSCGVDRPSCLVIVPPRSIIEEQINSNAFRMNVIGYVSQIAFNQMTREQVLLSTAWYSVRSRSGSS